MPSDKNGTYRALKFMVKQPRRPSPVVEPPMSTLEVRNEVARRQVRLMEAGRAGTPHEALRQVLNDDAFLKRLYAES